MAHTAQRISVARLRDLLQGPNPPLILDVRSDHAYEAATEHIPGDVRISPRALDERMGELPRNRPLVAYCT
ncbi:MAG: hypothetical protein HY320_08505 [Armatimonadetes bacterium]|nr:hypothetical protein [Armatimonadota bacterium]